MEGGESDDSKKKKKKKLFRESKLELVFAGHSIGHYSALVAAEAMGFEDGFRLIVRVCVCVWDCWCNWEKEIGSCLGRDEGRIGCRNKSVKCQMPMSTLECVPSLLGITQKRK